MMKTNNRAKRAIKISNEQLLKLLPNDSHWLVPITGSNFVRIPLKNFEDANILIDDLVFEIYKDENGNMFLELCSLYYNL